MRVLSLPTIKSFYEQPSYADAKAALTSWHGFVLKANWSSPADVKADFGTASILKNGRVVFHIAGNKYRLITSINYPHGIVFTKFIGTHKQYDAIDAQTIQMRSRMEIKPIRTAADHAAALKEIEGLMSAELGTPEGDRLDVLATLVEAYEARHFPIDMPDPIDAIKFRMEQKGLTPKDLQPMIGRSNRVYEVLSGTRPLTLAMIRRLHEGLDIPVECLIKQAAAAA